MRIKLAGGRLIDPANGVDAITDVYIAAGKIQAIGSPPRGFEVQREIAATGQVICPGLVDLSARLREPGDEHKATVASETRAAASAGITTLCCPPDTNPVIDTPAVVELIHQRAEQSGMARVLCLGALTQGLAGERLAEMFALKRIGCAGVTNGLVPIANTEVLRRAMEYAATCGLTVFLQALDPWLRNHGCMHEGAVSSRLGLPAIPETAETIALARDLLLIEQTGVRAHFCRLSTARAVEMVAEAQGKGLPVSADVCAHQLHLTDMDVADFNSMCHVQPPLRSLRDKEGLRQGVARGVISAICSDHQPHDRDAKSSPFSATEPGISALETLLPLSLRLVDQGVLGLNQALSALTEQPARILGITAGHLGVGANADICIFDPEADWILTEPMLISAGKNTPFLNWDFKGRVTHTLIGGRIVHEDKHAP
jgi:dihydroorotase